MHYRSVGHGYHAIPIFHPTSSNAPRHAEPEPGCERTLSLFLKLVLASREARGDKSSSDAEGRAGDSLTGLVKIRKLPLDSFAKPHKRASFPRSGCASSSRIICLSQRISRFGFFGSYARLSESKRNLERLSRENETTPCGGRDQGGKGCG